ncbi:PREDICTED: lysosomal alpha-mannosidase-like [Nicrophorus vespilloides]|uniref:Alpha-mannosidase n=1 Tax=Nicrophorus vespilloides TaxID=110193 RepID=A0ABM1NGU3_NICVS|nr:PREDICTED: lysosomal alpha-mannosidase-like [Nicrophorus vespilloides]
MFSVPVTLLCAVHLIYVSACGYNSCPRVKLDEINVHLVPHSHDDVGWVKTVDEYFDEDVNNILSTVVKALQENPRRRFIQVETAYFYKWWFLQDDGTKENVKRLLKSGQLEIVGGAWSMNDEAVTHYQSIIDQFTLGLKFLNETFGVCGLPRIGWQIDPFGHSSEMASIFKQMEYDALFLGRIHHEDRNERIRTKDMEFMWKDNSTGSSLFTSVLYDLYMAPNMIGHNLFCDSPIYASRKINVNLFKEHIEKVLKAYKTKNILIPIGGDFHYINANGCFENLDKLIRNMRGEKLINTKINVFYSTPSCYLKALHQGTNGNGFSTFSADFFPYADRNYSYWSGFYTSRPALKKLEREGNRLLQLQIFKQLHSLVPRSKYNHSNLDNLKRIMGVMQHHDAITGTETQYVADDYTAQLVKALDDNFKNINLLISIFQKNVSDIHYCPLKNVSICDFTSNNSRFTVTLYNPLAWTVSHYVYIPVNAKNFTVSHNNEMLPIQIRVNDKLFNESTENSIIFQAENIPPLGTKSFTIERKPGARILTPIVGRQSLHIGNEKTAVNLDKAGFVSSVVLRGIRVEMQQSILSYEGYVSPSFNHPSSGAYVFRPSELAKSFGKLMKLTVHKGELFDEINQVYNDWIKQSIRVYKDRDFVEFEWTVGPFPDDVGEEVISRFSTNLDTKKVFYTDVNGRGEIKRVTEKKKERISGNYYPVASRISLKDQSRDLKMTVYSDRPQGGASLISGQLELMLHRVTIDDDELGVGEPLREMNRNAGGLVTGRHILAMTSIHENYDDHIFNFPPVEWYSSVENLNFPQFSVLKRDFPKNVHLLSLEPWNEDSVLIRLEYNGKGSDTSVDLNDIFTFFKIKSFTETNLSGVKSLKRSYNFTWNGVHEESLKVENTLKVVLKPTQIRTFIAKVQYI